MAQNSLPDCHPSINNLLVSQQSLLEHHFKAEAMLEIILKTDFLSCSTTTIHDYLWVLSDIVNEAKTLNQQLLDELGRLMPLLALIPQGSLIH